VTRAADVLTIPAANLPWPEPVVIGPELFGGSFITSVVGGSSTATEDPAGTLNLTGDGTNQARGDFSFSTVVGNVYRVTVNVANSAVAYGIGPTQGSGAIASALLQVGDNSIVFVATSNTTWFRFFKSGAALSVMSNISVREINPLALSIQMDGRMTYADEGNFGTVVPFRRLADSNNSIEVSIDTASAETGEINAKIRYLGTQFTNNFVGNEYQPDVLVPINISGRFGSNFVNSAKDGIADTAITTPTGLPDLSTSRPKPRLRLQRHHPHLPHLGAGHWRCWSCGGH
jgi:hypothetical protein